MSNPWFRLYSEFATDPKVQILSEHDQRRLIMVLCMRCNSDVTLQDKHVTFQLRITAFEWATSKAIFIEAGFIDSENNVLNWNKRQYVSDTSAVRVARHRALHKIVTVTPCNVTVTAPEQIQNRTDTEQKQSKSKTSAAFALPDWVEEKMWNMWVSARKKMTVDQKQAQIDKMDTWRKAGLDHVGALANAAMNGYTGLFLPDSGKSAQGRKTPVPDNFSTKDYGQGISDL